jgi:hypothetical protein
MGPLAYAGRFRSNLVYGYVNSDNPGFVSGDTFDNTNYAAADLIWTLYDKVTLGVEYLWGRRENEDGASGTGDSDVTWQTTAGVGYRFDKFEIAAAYRYMKWEFDDDSVLDDLEIKGPLVGARFVF